MARDTAAFLVAGSAEFFDMRLVRPLSLLALVAAFPACARPPAAHDLRVAVAPGESLFVRVTGTGPDTLVVLHGGPGASHDYLVGALAPLARRHVLVFYDQRGRGRSGDVRDSSELSLATDVEDLEAIRAHFRLAQLTLVGHHWGGAVAAQYAIRHPGLVRRMVLLSPFPVHPSFVFEYGMANTDKPLVDSITAAQNAVTSPEGARAYCERYWPLYFELLPQRIVRTVRDGALRRAVCGGDARRLQQSHAVFFRLVNPLGYWSWRVALNGTRVPTLVVEGQGDGMVTQAAERWAQHLPDARLLETEGPFGFPWVGAGARRWDAVETFLGGAWPDRAVQPKPFEAAAVASGKAE